MIISQANIEDLGGILSLLKENHINYIREENKQDGFVTTNITDSQLEALIVQECGVTIAKDNGKVIVICSSFRLSQAEIRS